MDDPAGWTKLANYTLSRENDIPVEAFFVHAVWKDLSEEYADMVANLYHQVKPRIIALNGLESHDENFPGILYWKDALVNKRKVPSEVLRIVKSSAHTLEESMEFMRIVKEEHVSTALVLSIPVHIFRAFLTNLGALKKLGLPLKIYPRTFRNIDWEKRVVLRALTRAHAGDDTVRVGRLAGECARIMLYRKLYEGGNDKYIVASIEEGINYVENELKEKL